MAATTKTEEFNNQYAALVAAGAPAELVGSVGFAIDNDLPDDKVMDAIDAAWDVITND